MTIGEYIKQKRQSAGMTQQDLASKVGISYQQLSQYERGVRSPKPEMLEKLSEAIGYYFPEFMRLYYASLSKTKEQGQSDKTDLGHAKLPDPDLEALRHLMNVNGFDLYQSAGSYCMVGKTGTYRLSEEQLRELLEGSVQNIDSLCSMLESVLSHLPQRKVSDWLPENNDAD